MGECFFCVQKVGTIAGEVGQTHALVIVHTFNNHSGEICIPVEGDYEIADKYETGDHKIALGDGMICFTFEEDFDAIAVILKKK